MSRLQAETARLYLPLADQPQGHVRALVLTLGRPAEWAPMAAVWQAVQSELGLPAPAIAVSGTDSYQLWFSLAEPVPAAQAHAFLAALCQRHLSAVAPGRCVQWPDEQDAPKTEGATSAMAAGMDLPGREVAPEQWSAFVAPDLAPMFADTPWLDLPPSPEGQGELLSRLHSITPSAWQAAMKAMKNLEALSAPQQPSACAQSAQPMLAAHSGTYDDPRRFLMDVMNNEQIAMALRIEAAKALLGRG